MYLNDFKKRINNPNKLYLIILYYTKQNKHFQHFRFSTTYFYLELDDGFFHSHAPSINQPLILHINILFLKMMNKLLHSPKKTISIFKTKNDLNFIYTLGNKLNFYLIKHSYKFTFISYRSYYINIICVNTLN